MFWNDHAPPHFHAVYGGEEAVFVIETLEISRGEISRRAKTLVLEWAQEHRQELLENWKLCRLHQMPKDILPLT